MRGMRIGTRRAHNSRPGVCTYHHDRSKVLTDDHRHAFDNFHVGAAVISEFESDSLWILQEEHLCPRHLNRPAVSSEGFPKNSFLVLQRTPCFFTNLLANENSRMHLRIHTLGIYFSFFFCGNLVNVEWFERSKVVAGWFWYIFG